MHLPRRRITLGFLMTSLAVATILLWVGLGLWDRVTAKRIVKTYYVGDLLKTAGPEDVGRELSRCVGTVTSAVPLGFRWSRPRSVKPFPLTLSLIVDDTEPGHDQVATWLRERREQEDKLARLTREPSR
jgi:hypothetical protein